MPYLVKGNAQQIFSAFGQDWVTKEGTDDLGHIHLDLPRTDFLGTEEQAVKHFNTWRQEALGRYYLQGNMSAGNFQYLLGPNPLMKKEENPEDYDLNFIRQHFAYFSDAGEASGLMVMYRKDDPKQWMMGLVKKGSAAPKDRELIFLSSFDLAPFIQSPDSGVTVSSVGFLDNPLKQQIGSTLPSTLLQNAVHVDTGEINLRFQRVDLLTRKLKIAQETVTLRDPIPFADLNLSALFADNPALDLIIQYKVTDDFHVSFAMLKDLLSESSGLRKEIEALKLTSDENINKNLLKMIIVFYENGILEKNRKLLNDLVFVKTFGGVMWDEIQIKLIPFLIQQKYDEDLIGKILSETAYFKAIESLVALEPALTQDVPEFFKDHKKLDDLKFIHNLPNEDCKKLCLIFWVKGALSEDGYQEIVAATNQYSLLASTLVALDQTKTIDIDSLRKLALNPEQHLQESIIHHFDKELKPSHGAVSNLPKLNLQELEAASSALLLLKKSGITEPKLYQRVLGNDKKGQALLLFLPQLANIKNEMHRKSLIDILYAGVIHGIQTQGNEVLAIKDPEQLVLAKKLRERFICVTQMQDLGLNKEMVELAAQEDTDYAKRFRQVILRVEEQCKIVYERLSGTASDMLMKWQQEEENYRKTLYSIAYEGLMKPHTELHSELQKAEDNILNIVDPKIESDLYNALIIIANIIITCISLGVANAIKYRSTGNFWFFNQTRSGEELRALDKEVLGLIELEKDDESAAALVELN